jgi:hypothetical protein
MAFRYNKIYPQSTPLPITLLTTGINGVFEFNISAGTTFNLSKSLLNISLKINALASRYPIISGTLSQFINRIQLVNSNNQILTDINDAYSYSTQTILQCNSKCGFKRSQIYSTQTTQIIANQNTIYNINKIKEAELTGADAELADQDSVGLYLQGSDVNQTVFFSYASDFKFMYPKTIFSLDKNIHTKENLKIYITLNPADLFAYFGTSPGDYQKTNSIPNLTSSITNFYINLYTTPSIEDTNFTVNCIEPEIQKIIVTSKLIHNVRTMLKPNKDIGFITWSPYSSGYQTGSEMFGNSMNDCNRNNVARQAIKSYDLRLSGNPLIQNQPIDCIAQEHILVNMLHYHDSLLTTGNINSTINLLGFVNYTTFDGRGIYDFDPNNTSYLSTEIPLELTNDVVLDGADTKSHQFVIGYKKTIKSENGFLSVVV